MLLELVRLRLRLLRNYALSSPRTTLRVVLEGILLVALAALLHAGAAGLSSFDDALVWRVAAVAGSGICCAAFLVPAMAARPELLDRRALRGYGLRVLPLAAALLPVSLAAPLLPYLLALATLPLSLWVGRSFGSEAGTLVVVLLGLQLLLTVLLGRALGAHLREHPGLLPWTRVGGAAVLLFFLAATALMLLPRAVPLLGDELGGSALRLLGLAGGSELFRLDESLAASPLGALWVALAPGALGTPGLLGRSAAIGMTTLAALVIVWVIVVAADLRPTRRNVPVREREAPTAFRGLSSSPLGAVAARSAVYWVRDPRYRTVLLFLPVIPAVVLFAALVGGVPFGTAALLPLPLVLLLLGWATLHNDIAYDSTAMWSLLAVQLDGRADRMGRAIPVLVLGGTLLLVGTPLTVWAYGDLSVLPIVLGVSLALLLGAVGVSSAVSVRWPYPAPRPGDGAFQQPVSGGSQGFGIQAFSLLLALLVAAPAVLTAVLWLFEVPGPWNWLSLAAGAILGGAALVVGIRLGGRDFNEAAPELLAYTMRN